MLKGKTGFLEVPVKYFHKNLFFHNIHIIKPLLQVGLTSMYAAWDNSISGLTGHEKTPLNCSVTAVFMMALHSVRSGNSRVGFVS